jgi:diguanylate cyclase (GGDEF)-like protein/PAS domain S-box-containing protein
LWVEVTNQSRLADPDHHDVLTEVVNIDDEMTMHEELRANAELFRQLTQALPVGVLHVDRNGAVVFANRRIDDIFAMTAPTHVDLLLARIVEEDRAGFDEAFAAVTGSSDEEDIEAHLMSVDGKPERICRITLRPLRDAKGVVTGAIAAVTDVTDGAHLRDELRDRATFDELTRCHNRASTMRELGRLLGAGSQVAVVFIDLDGFKPVNDELGHSAGDELLTLVANRLRSCVRSNDVVGRMGGDEFVVLYAGVADATVLGNLAGRLQHALRDEVVLGQGVARLRASVGGVLVGPGDDADQAIADADAAMYEAKRARSGRPVLR